MVPGVVKLLPGRTESSFCAEDFYRGQKTIENKIAKWPPKWLPAQTLNLKLQKVSQNIFNLEVGLLWPPSLVRKWEIKLGMVNTT